uniref:F5/8 type C domain-containing protein n=1 Tax=Branchiostoma floridae TaxID=7739 RepID=C3ZFC6_BRAFL|eukprot:XP_002592669.1 hypothetical protein BRAFLDRAFT_67102 [Branchiostoma floridae]
MTASSQVSGSEAYRGRLNGDGAWEPSGQGTNEFLAVDLQYNRYIFGIQTQGQGNGYVETYSIIYQMDNTTDLRGSTKVFTGNSDSETIAQQNFTSYIYARYILVNPQTFSGAPRLRIELLGVDELPTTNSPTSHGAYQPIGVEDNSIIPDDLMTATSQVTGSEAYRGRLNGDGAWQPSGQGTNEFLAVDLQYNRYIFGIQTQGQGNGYVETYRIIYQMDNTTDLRPYSEDGGSANLKNFTGNSDSETIVQQDFASFIYARYILVNPQNFSGAPRLRIELLGVDGQSSNVINVAAAAGGGGVAFLVLIVVAVFLFMRRRKKKRARAPPVEETSSNSTGYANASFVPIAEQTRQSVQDDAAPVPVATRAMNQIANHGMESLNENDNEVFTGNSDSETIAQQNFTSYIYARYILVNPQTFSGAPRLRIELLGVDELPTTNSPTSHGAYQPIGVEDNSIIPDDLMTATSQVTGSEAYRGRLNGDGAWQPSGQGTNEFLAVDLQYNRYIFGIQTQGQGNGYVETYSIIYQMDNTTDLRGSTKVFTGNSDSETIAQQNFTSYIYARYILVNPQTFSGAPKLRIELLGVDDSLIAKVADFGLSRGKGIYEQTSKMVFRNSTLGDRHHWYQMIMMCWKTRPEERPSFADLAEQLEIMIEDKHSYLNADKGDDFEYETVDTSDSDVA